MPNGLQILLNKIKLENTDALLFFIAEMNKNKVESYQIGSKLQSLPTKILATITDTQLELLKTMKFRGGYGLSIGSYKTKFPKFLARYQRIPHNMFSFVNDNISDIQKEDLIFFSDYHKAKWKKLNPTRTNTKGTEFTFQMNNFSLQIFKNSIKHEFLRTEAKNFIIKVNKAFTETTRATSTGHTAATKIRNKFYAIILDNTKVHTKTMLNTLQPTDINNVNGIYYPAEEDEALVVSLGYYGNPLSTFNTVGTMSTYVADTNLVTHNNGYLEERDSIRLVSAASVLLVVGVNSGNTAYTTLANRMLTSLDKSTRSKVINQITSIQQLHTILKEQT